MPRFRNSVDSPVCKLFRLAGPNQHLFTLSQKGNHCSCIRRGHTAMPSMNLAALQQAFLTQQKQYGSRKQLSLSPAHFFNCFSDQILPLSPHISQFGNQMFIKFIFTLRIQNNSAHYQFNSLSLYTLSKYPFYSCQDQLVKCSYSVFSKS